jgi:hypothetical protein
MASAGIDVRKVPRADLDRFAASGEKATALQAQELGRLMAKAMPTFSRTIAIP